MHELSHSWLHLPSGGVSSSRPVRGVGSGGKTCCIRENVTSAARNSAVIAAVNRCATPRSRGRDGRTVCATQNQRPRAGAPAPHEIKLGMERAVNAWEV